MFLWKSYCFLTVRNVISPNLFQYMMRIVSKNGWCTKVPGDVLGQMGENIF